MCVNKGNNEGFKKYNIQIPFIKWNERTLFRISIQVYNTKEDIDMLCVAIENCRKIFDLK